MLGVMSVNRAGWLRVALAYATFVMIGAGDAGFGVVLPSIQRAYGIDKATVSLLFLCGTSGYLTAAFTSGLLVDKLGIRRFLSLGALVFVLGALGLSVAPPFVLVMGIYIGFGFSVGVLDAGLNAYVAGLPNNTSMLNYLHACYGLGALIGPVVAGTILTIGLGWNALYLVWSILGLLVLVGTWLVYTGIARPKHDEVGMGGNVLKAALRLRVVWLTALFLLLYVGGEVSLGNWGYSLLTEDRAIHPYTASWFVSGYWMGLTVGRLVLGSLAKRLGDRTLIQLCIAGVLLGMVVVWVPAWEVVSAVGLWFTGFAFGPIFPTAIAMLSRIVPERLLPSAIGFVASAGSAGAAFFPWVAGNLAEGAGLWTLMPYVSLLSLGMAAIWVLMKVPKGEQGHGSGPVPQRQTAEVGGSGT